MPYREMPQGVMPRPDDPDEVARVFEHRDRFGRLDAAKLWPAPETRIFDPQSLDAFAVSANGERALLCASTRAWLLDTRTMIASVSIALPGCPRICALNADGTRAAFVHGETLYRWDTGDLVESLEDLPEVWSSHHFPSTEILELSQDGRVAVTSSYSQRATVRVYDMDAATMTHSFVSDSDECLILHPNGRHLICFGDDRHARFYGREGLYAQLENCTGGAFSPDGKTLLVNDLETESELRLYGIDASGPTLVLGPEGRIRLRRNAKRWDCQARFSPSGSHALISVDHEHLYHVAIETGECRVLPIQLERKTAILADESLLLSSKFARDFGVQASGLALLDAETGKASAVLCATYGQEVKLVAVSSIGIYGSIVDSGGPIGEAPRQPFERPSLMSAFLAEGVLPLDRDEQLRLKELQERQRVWQQHLSGFTVDITSRQLMAINRGLIELTPEIVERARVATNHPDTPRFGAHKVNLAALQAAGAELAGLSLGARQEAFSKMVNRMRGGPSSTPPAVIEVFKEASDEVEGEVFEEAFDEYGVASSSFGIETLPPPISVAEPKVDSMVAAKAAELEAEERSALVASSILVASVMLGVIGYWLAMS